MEQKKGGRGNRMEFSRIRAPGLPSASDESSLAVPLSEIQAKEREGGGKFFGIRNLSAHTGRVCVGSNLPLGYHFRYLSSPAVDSKTPNLTLSEFL